MYFSKYFACIFRKEFLQKSHSFILSQTRFINISRVCLKTVPDNLKGKSKSSQDWLTRQINDVYVKRSRYHGYRCRSAYKLLEIDEKYNILKPGFSVVDCGASPGSWTQIVVKKLKLDQDSKDNIQRKSVAVAVDLEFIEPIKGAIVLQKSNFTSPSVQEEIWKLLPDKKADVILSDMAPKASGTHELDSELIMSLVYSALKFSVITLKKDGTFLCKVWDNREVERFLKTLESLFSSVKRVRPKASRADSAELFLLARGYKYHNFTNKVEV